MCSKSFVTVILAAIWDFECSNKTKMLHISCQCIRTKSLIFILPWQHMCHFLPILGSHHDILNMCLVAIFKNFNCFNISLKCHFHKYTLSKKSSWTLIEVQFSQKCFILGKLKAKLCEAGECPLHFDTKLEGIDW